MKLRHLTTLSVACFTITAVKAMDYPYAPFNDDKMEPRKTGRPLTEAERAFVLWAEYERRACSMTHGKSISRTTARSTLASVDATSGSRLLGLEATKEITLDAKKLSNTMPQIKPASEL